MTPGQLRQLSSLETSVCAVLSKLAASVVTYPSQVIRYISWRVDGAVLTRPSIIFFLHRRSRLQQRSCPDGGGSHYRGPLQAVAMTWRNEGVRGFYRGLGPALVRTLPQSALTLTVYEKMLQWLPSN